MNKTGNMRINKTLKRVLIAIFAVEKQKIFYILNVSVVLNIQQEMRMRNIAINGLFGSIIFFHLIYKRHDFLKEKVILNKICVSIFSPKFA